MPDDPRRLLVSRMIDEGLDDAEIQATLSAYDARQTSRGNDPSRLPRKPVSAEDFMTPDEIANRDMTALDVVKGFGKGAVRSLADLANLAVQSRAIPGLSAPPEVIESVKPQYANPAQQLGGTFETVAETAVPVIRGAKAAGSLARGAVNAFGEPVAKALMSETSLLTQARQAAARKVLGRVIELTKDKPAATGRLVTEKGPALDEVLASALDDLRAPQASPVGTLPPQPSLPPGYTPRASVPAPSRVRPAPVESAPEPSPTLADIGAPSAPKRSTYFLRTPEEMADIKAASTPRAPRASITVDDLPASWKSRVGQDIFPTTGANAKEIRDALLTEIQGRGMSVGEAIALVSRNKDIPTALRSQLMRAISKAGS